MPFVNIQILEGRSDESIAACIKAVTRTVCESLEVPPERVRVVVTEVPKKRWAVGGKLKSEE